MKQTSGEKKIYIYITGCKLGESGTEVGLCYQSAGAPGMPLPGAGTSTAFLSSVRPTHCSTSRASRSISSSDFSGNVSQGRISSQHVEKMTASTQPPPYRPFPWVQDSPCLLMIFLICSSRYSRRLIRASDQRSRTQLRSSSWNERRPESALAGPVRRRDEDTPG